MDEIVHAENDLVEIDGLRAQLLAARESEKLLRQFLGPARGQGGGVDEAQQAGLLLKPPLEEFEIAGDHGQHIVEIMRDAAGELAHRFHLLRLAKRILDAPPLGDFAPESDAANDLAAATIE